MTFDEVMEGEVMVSRKEAHYEVCDKHGMHLGRFSK
jgi:hypothetical protein